MRLAIVICGRLTFGGYFPAPPRDQQHAGLSGDAERGQDDAGHGRRPPSARDEADGIRRHDDGAAVGRSAASRRDS
jgi:hypothetical protein